MSDIKKTQGLRMKSQVIAMAVGTTLSMPVWAFGTADRRPSTRRRVSPLSDEQAECSGHEVHRFLTGFFERIAMQNQNAVSIEPMEDGLSSLELRARAGYYQLLAGAFVEEPGRDFLAALRAPEVLAELDLQFDTDFTELSLDTLQDVLACEYATLFTTSGGYPPVESSRLTGRFQQEPFHDAKAIYQRCGFELQQGKFAVFEDQLGVELTFVAELLENQAAALERGDMAAAKRLEKEIKRFWATHLGRWVRGYATLLERVTEHSFYREIARLLRDFAEAELALLKVRVDDMDGGQEVVPKSEINVLFNPDEPVCGGCDHGKQESRVVA